VDIVFAQDRVPRTPRSPSLMPQRDAPREPCRERRVDHAAVFAGDRDERVVAAQPGTERFRGTTLHAGAAHGLVA
jgi:hypothetical protein